MQQKIIWMRFSLIGISIILLSFMTIGCKQVDYSVRAKWVYINETNLDVKYPKGWDDFNVSAKDTLIYETDTEGPEQMNAENYVPPINANIIFFNDNLCDTLNVTKPGIGDGPLGINNYDSRRLGERYYEFTFRYTQQMVDSAVNCQ